MLSGRTLRSGLQTGFQPVACSLCADGVRRYSARINAFILLPLYYSGTAQGSQGGTKNDPECPPRCSGHNLRKIILVFVNLENLRIFQIYFFTGGVVKANGIARFFRSAALPKEAALQMSLAVATLSVKMDPRSVRRRSGGPKSQIFFPLKLRRAKRSAIKIVWLYPGYRLTSSSSSARFTCSAVGGTASGRG